MRARAVLLLDDWHTTVSLSPFFSAGMVTALPAPLSVHECFLLSRRSPSAALMVNFSPLVAATSCPFAMSTSLFSALAFFHLLFEES